MWVSLYFASDCLLLRVLVMVVVMEVMDKLLPPLESTSFPLPLTPFPSSTSFPSSLPHSISSSHPRSFSSFPASKITFLLIFFLFNIFYYFFLSTCTYYSFLVCSLCFSPLLLRSCIIKRLISSLFFLFFYSLFLSFIH